MVIGTGGGRGLASKEGGRGIRLSIYSMKEIGHVTRMKNNLDGEGNITTEGS